MSSSFTCPTCGNTHEGLPTDYGWKLPDEVWAISEDERSERAKFDSDRCQFGNRYFARCLLKLPFKEQPGYYGWGIWVELSERDFYRYVEIYDEDGSDEPPVPGTIANAIPGYPSTSNLPVVVQFQDSTSRPTVSVPENRHPIARDQCCGIDHHRYHEILVATGALSGL